MSELETSQPSRQDDSRPLGMGWRNFVLSHDEGTRRDDEGKGDSASSVPDRAFLLHMANLRKRPTLDVDVVSHCNLNCVSCCHFSPIAKPAFLSPEEYEHDIALLARIEGVEGFFDALCIMGGEPLLHPRLSEFFLIAHRLLPQLGVRLVTNGLLLDEAPRELWDALRASGAGVLITPYPTGLDYARLARLVADKGVRVALGGGLASAGDGSAFFLKTPLDPCGTLDPAESFVSCPLGGVTMQLRDGKVYPCNKSALIDLVNDRFGTQFKLEPQDCLELASIRTAREIDDFRHVAKPLCRHCAQDLTKRIVWRRSAGAAEEWLLNEAEQNDVATDAVSGERFS